LDAGSYQIPFLRIVHSPTIVSPDLYLFAPVSIYARATPNSEPSTQSALLSSSFHGKALTEHLHLDQFINVFLDTSSPPLLSHITDHSSYWFLPLIILELVHGFQLFHTSY
jgi:hypothetical protein